MKVLIIGASSYLGARIYYDLNQQFEVIGTYSSNKLCDNFIHLDITDRKQVSSVIQTTKPQVIIHAGNNANARWCEANPQKAKTLNNTATETIVEQAAKVASKVFYISSFAAAQHSNVYAQTKKQSELIVKKSEHGWLILRPSLIIGYSPNTTNDRPFNRLLKNIDTYTPAIYDTSWKFYPTYIRHITEVLSIAIYKDIYGYILPIAVEELKTRYDIAKDILTPFGVKVIGENKKDTTPVITQNLSKLDKIGFPTYSYISIIESIVAEVKNREKYNNLNFNSIC